MAYTYFGSGNYSSGLPGSANDYLAAAERERLRRASYSLPEDQRADFMAGKIDASGKPLYNATAGAPATSYDPAYGGIPQVPSPQGTAAQATTANLQNLPGLLDLSSQLNAYNLAQQRGQYEASFPNYSQMESQISQNLLSGARGELSEGTMSNLRQEAAERGVAIGQPSTMGGPTVSNMNLLRNMGLTTEQLQQNALTGLAQYNALSPRTALYNPASMFTTPEQQYNAALQANIWAAAPVPSAAAAAAMAAARSGANYGYKGALAPNTGAAASVPTAIYNRYAPTAGYAPIQQAQAIQGAQTGSQSYPVGPSWNESYLPSGYSAASYGLNLTPSYTVPSPVGQTTSPAGYETPVYSGPASYLNDRVFDVNQIGNYNPVPQNLYPTEVDMPLGWDYDWTGGSGTAQSGW